MSAKLTPATRARFQNPTSPTTRALHRRSRRPHYYTPGNPVKPTCISHPIFATLYAKRLAGWLAGEKTNGRKETRAGVGTKRSNALCSSFMLLAPTLAPSVLHSEKQRGKKRKEKKKEGEKRRKKGKGEGKKRKEKKRRVRNTRVGNKPPCYSRVFRVFRPLAFRN